MEPDIKFLFSIKRKKLFYFFFNKPEEKTGDEEQREELESDLAEVATEAEEIPPSTTLTENKEPTENQDGGSLKEHIADETQEAVSQPDVASTHSGPHRPQKNTAPPAQKKTSIKKEEERVGEDVPVFQDDPSDTDYTPSTYLN